jgi:hypothetical protein
MSCGLQGSKQRLHDSVGVFVGSSAEDRLRQSVALAARLLASSFSRKFGPPLLRSIDKHSHRSVV